nr:hypothetical protein [Tanacetum cinerariifolium]
YPVIHPPPQESSVKILRARENLMKSIQTFLKKFNRISFRETPKVLLLAWEKFFEIQHAQPEDIHELLRKLLEDLQIINEELAEYINSPSWNCPTFYDDDDDEYIIQYREDLENSSNAITPDLPNEEPDNSLSMGDEHLSTIPEMNWTNDDDSFEDIDYVKASPLDSELVSLEESPSPFPIPVEDSDSFFEKSGTSLSYSDNSLPEFKTFIDYTKETRDPHVHVPNVLPTHLTLMLHSDFMPSDDSFGSDLEVSFPSGTRNKIFDPEIFFEVRSKRFLLQDTFSNLLFPVSETLLSFSFENEDKVFNPGILSSNFLSHQGKITFDFSESPMMIYGWDIPFLDDLFLHFYPP